MLPRQDLSRATHQHGAIRVATGSAPADRARNSSIAMGGLPETVSAIEGAVFRFDRGATLRLINPFDGPTILGTDVRGVRGADDH